MAQEAVNQTGPSSEAEATSATESTATGSPTKAAAAGYTSVTKVNSMTDLKEKAPEVYDAMMEGIAITIINRMKRSQDHLKEMMREGNRNARG